MFSYSKMSSTKDNADTADRVAQRTNRIALMIKRK
jgi:hypothetical protein